MTTDYAISAVFLEYHIFRRITIYLLIVNPLQTFPLTCGAPVRYTRAQMPYKTKKQRGKLTMKDKKLTTYQMAVTAVMAAVLCVLGPLTVPIGAVPISLANFVICLTAWLLGPKFGTLSVVLYLVLGAIGIPVFSGYGAGLAKLAGPTGGYLVGYLLLAFIGGMFIEKSKGNPVISAVGLVLGDAACYVLGTAWFVFQMQCELGYALTVCVYPFIALDLGKIVVSCIVGALLRKRLTQAGVLKLQNAVSE